MVKLTKIYGQDYFYYDNEVKDLTDKITALKKEPPKTWLERMYPYDPHSEKNVRLENLSKNLDMNNIYKEILSHNHFYNDNSIIINPKEQYEDGNLPDNIYKLIKAYKEKWKDEDLLIFDFMLINGNTKFIDVDSRGRKGGNKKSNRCNNKKTNSKKYRKYRRKSHKKSHKKSHRKYNK